jgi:hypothetical protein
MCQSKNSKRWVPASVKRALKRLGIGRGDCVGYVHLMTNGFITGQVLAVDGGVMLRK